MTATHNTAVEIEYAVFGAGWGSQQFGRFGSGKIAYEGSSLAQAKRALAKEQAAIKRMQKRADMRNVSDTYAIFARSAAYKWQWVALDKFSA